MAEQDYACVGRGCQRAAMQTEIERLRAEVKRLDDGWTDCVWHLQSAHKAMGVWKPALVAAEADRDRLRAALEDVRERVQEIANRYHEQHFVIDTVARLLCETIPAALAGDAKHEVVRLGDGATYCPGCTVTFPVEIGPVVAGSGENIAGTFTVGPVVPASASPSDDEAHDRSADWNWIAGAHFGFGCGVMNDTAQYAAAIAARRKLIAESRAAASASRNIAESNDRAFAFGGFTWSCQCGQFNAGHVYRCPKCERRRRSADQPPAAPATEAKP